VKKITTSLKEAGVNELLLPPEMAYSEVKLFDSRFRGYYSLPKRVDSDNLINEHSADLKYIQTEYLKKLKDAYRSLRENLRTTIEAENLLGHDFESSVAEEGRETCSICGISVVKAERHIFTVHKDLASTSKAFAVNMSKNIRKTNNKAVSSVEVSKI